MTTAIQFILIGLSVGAIYALGAAGMIVVYRGSGIINFASGAVGMVGAYAFWILHDNDGWGFTEAFILSIALCMAIGLAVQLLVMHPLRSSSPLTRLLATLGVLTTLSSLVSIKYPEQAQVVSSSLPVRAVHIWSISIGIDRLAIIGIAIGLFAALAIVYRTTTFGRATTAVAENPRGAAALGFSPGRLAAYSWMLGSGLAGTAAILFAPLAGLSVEQFTFLITPSLAAMVVANFSSFPVALVAGLAIGVIESLVGLYVSTSGWSTAVPFLLMILVLSIRGRSIPDRAHVRLRMPTVGTGRIRPGLVLVVVAVSVALLWTLSVPWVVAIEETLISAIVLLSIVVVSGYCGQLSLAQFALAGVGAFVAGRLAAAEGLPFLWAGLVGLVVAVPTGIVVGLPALRTRGPALAIATLGLSTTIEAVVFDSVNFTGGQSGTNVGSPHILGIDVNNVTYPRRYALVILIALLLTSLAVANLRRGRTGRRMLAVRANERAAASLGVSLSGTKLYAFALGSVIASLGGILIAFSNPSVDYTQFNAFTSVTLVCFAIVGGLGQILGAVAGGLFQPGGVFTNVGQHFSSSIQTYLTLAAGVFVIMTLISAQDGLAYQWVELGHRIERLVRRRADKQSMIEPQLREDRPGMARSRVKPVTLKADGVSVSFAGTRALDSVSIEVNPGEVVGLIGPNGAGKTTFIDVVTGFVSRRGGKVTFGEIDVSGVSAGERARLGIGRSFQSLELFEDMTVLENLLVASEERSRRAFVTDLVKPGRLSLNPAALAAVEEFALWDYLHRRPTELTYGRRRLVAIARSIAALPSVLLLDEPATGLDESERRELSVLIRRLADDWGMAVLLIEHDVDLVMRTCDRVNVLHFGQLIAAGAPGEVRNSREVIDAYLGEPVGEVRQIARDPGPVQKEGIR